MMGPYGLRRRYRPICTWILSTTSNNICYMGSRYLHCAAPTPFTSSSTRMEATVPRTRQKVAHASMPVFAADVPLPFHHIFRLPVPRQLLPFTHRLPPLLTRDSPPSLPTAQPAHKMTGALQTPILPLSLDSQRVDLKSSATGEAHQVVGSTNEQRACGSGDR
jgi:hypothetical protein